MKQSRRTPALVAVVGVLVAGWVVDSQVERPTTRVTTDVQAPMGARPAARSSAWFCTGATANADGVANGTVVVANAGTRALTGTLTVIPSEGDTKAAPISIPGSGRAAVPLADLVTAPYASAVVELDGGQAVVELAATGSLGDSVTPCASSASTNWYFAEGITTKDATEILALFNPFPEDAVVDLVFTTEEGEVTPQALTGVSVRGRGMLAINTGEHVQRREAVSTRIQARAGRLTAARLQTFDGSASRKGMSLALGAPSPGTLWYFPEGFLAEGLIERFQVYNPNATEAKVDLELALEQGQAEPISLTIPPVSRVTMSANDEARIPKNVPHAITVRSTNGVGVVAERTIDAASPNPRSGLAITLGARLTARQWVVAAGQSDDTNDEWLVLHNPGAGPAFISVVLLDGRRVAPPALDRVEVGPRQRRALRLGDTLPDGATSLLVTANQPIVVERDVYKLQDLGTSMSPAIPLRA